VCRCVADVVIKEDLQGVFVIGIQEQQLAGVRPLVPALPERVEIPDGKRPAWEFPLKKLQHGERGPCFVEKESPKPPFLDEHLR
jgi:hypothetical protein